VSGVTISAIKADMCGCVGHFAVHQDLIAEARRRRVKDAVIQGLLIDARAIRQVTERMHERWEPIGEPAPIAAWR
jgi:fructose 1,6-bisphosphatase